MTRQDFALTNYVVSGAMKNTGAQVTVEIEAVDRAHAQKLANEDGILVTSISPKTDMFGQSADHAADYTGSQTPEHTHAAIRHFAAGDQPNINRNAPLGQDQSTARQIQLLNETVERLRLETTAIGEDVSLLKSGLARIVRSRVIRAPIGTIGLAVLIGVLGAIVISSCAGMGIVYALQQYQPASPRWP